VKPKRGTFFPTAGLKSFFNGVSVLGLTVDAAVLFLSDLNMVSSKHLFLAFKNEKDALDLYNRCMENKKDRFYYYPDLKGLDFVPGFIPEERRYQKETVLSLISKKSAICFGTQKSITRKTIKKQTRFSTKRLEFSLGKTLNIDNVISTLIDFGYNKRTPLSGSGEYSLRGDILDIYPHHFKNPVRLSFNLEKIERISLFNPSNQLTIQSLKKLILKDLVDLQGSDFIDLIKHSRRGFVVDVVLDNARVSFLNNPTTKNCEFITSEVFLSTKTTKEKLSKIKILAETAERIFLVTKNPSFDKSLLPKSQLIERVFGSIERSFVLNCEYNFLVLSDNEIFSKYSTGNKWQPINTNNQLKTAEVGFSNLKPGDLIVHVSFGVGRYLGIFEKESRVGVKEGVEIEYKDNARVFVSLDQLFLVHRYIGGGKKPTLSALGTKTWSTELKKTRKAAEEVVSEIIKTYTEKPEKRGFSYTKESDIDNMLSGSFSFVETKDQKQAILDVYRDLNKEKPMDRLICGDVGFGKTEVAIRGIFKAFLSDRLSVLLCPTTILADQHYITCKERFSNLGVSIALLSRFNSSQNQKNTIKKLTNKKIDVLIGTHRILSKDVLLPCLGLLIIDEEHRFGVRHKEKIRSLKSNVDVLTLTATPIPRTLQQSLVGLRGISTIKTPPVSRKPISTSVNYFNWSEIASKIKKELLRGGQVYFLNNDTRTIPIIVQKLKRIFSSSVIAGASGKMVSKELEKTVLAFFAGRIDILVCTTIIESGLDVTNANTIIINNAQNFGLSQLYQIRGRVGRGGREAHCLLLIPTKKTLENDAFRRLKTIEQNTALGAGYNISMKDLEIRGAGSLFGYKQSGHITAVGFEVYCEILKEELNKRKNKLNKKDTIIQTDVLPQINKDYIKDRSLRVNYYYRIAKATKKEEINKIEESMVDAFGSVPDSTKILLNIARLKVDCFGTPLVKIIASNQIVSVSLGGLGAHKSIDDLFLSISTFKHKRLLNYRYENTGMHTLSLALETKNLFPNMELLFSFVDLFITTN